MIHSGEWNRLCYVLIFFNVFRTLFSMTGFHGICHDYVIISFTKEFQCCDLFVRS